MAPSEPARHRKPKKELDHLRVHKAENGGHIVEHHFTSFEHEPEHHVFGEHEGEDMMDHIAGHMGVKTGGTTDEEAESEPEGEEVKAEA